MTLGILPNLGDSFLAYRKSGRDTHWENNYLKFYKEQFNEIFFFSYAKEKNPYPALLAFKANSLNLPRFIYTFLLPFFNIREIKSCNVLRVRQILGCLPAIIAKILWGKPMLSTYGYDYAYFALKDRKYFFVPFIKLVEYLGLRFSDAVIVTNEQMRKKASSAVNLRKIFLLPNGVDTILFKPKGKKNNHITTIVSVGRLVEQKNFKSLIGALGLVSGRKKIKLVIIGRGPLENELKSFAKKKKINMQLIRQKTYYEMPAVYQNADIFVLPSFYEGSPKVLLEAMACGLPCIASDKAYASFIIKDGKNGLLVQPKPQSIAQKINLILADKKLKEIISKEARKTILERFDNRVIIKKEIEILKQLGKCKKCN